MASDHAMTSDRPYRSARSSFEALKELRALAGDATSLEEAFLRLVTHLVAA